MCQDPTIKASVGELGVFLEAGHNGLLLHYWGQFHASIGLFSLFLHSLFVIIQLEHFIDKHLVSLLTFKELILVSCIKLLCLYMGFEISITAHYIQSELTSETLLFHDILFGLLDIFDDFSLLIELLLQLKDIFCHN